MCGIATLGTDDCSVLAEVAGMVCVCVCVCVAVPRFARKVALVSQRGPPREPWQSAPEGYPAPKGKFCI